MQSFCQQIPERLPSDYWCKEDDDGDKIQWDGEEQPLSERLLIQKRKKNLSQRVSESQDRRSNSSLFYYKDLDFRYYSQLHSAV